MSSGNKNQALQMLQSFAAGVADERPAQLHLLMLFVADVCMQLPYGL